MWIVVPFQNRPVHIIVNFIAKFCSQKHPPKWTSTAFTLLHPRHLASHQGCGVRGFWVESDFLSDCGCELDHFLHHTPKLGIPVEMVKFLSKLLLKQISCCALRLPFILTVKFHSDVTESEILENSESDILPPTPQPCFPPWCTETNQARSTSLSTYVPRTLENISTSPLRNNPFLYSIKQLFSQRHQTQSFKIPLGSQLKTQNQHRQSFISRS